MTLTDFLLARIAEDEHDGRYATTWELCSAVAADHEAGRNAAVAARRRVLAECEAKRRIVNISASGASPDTDDWAQVAWDVLCDLASVYADHPDYRNEWRP